MLSHRTVALVSQDYLNSETCLKELDIALAFNGGKQLVVIVLDTTALKLFMGTNPACSAMLKMYFQTHSYLEFDNGCARFYKKLANLLPEKEIENGVI